MHTRTALRGDNHDDAAALFTTAADLTFDPRDTARPIGFSGASLEGGGVTVTLPATAVVILTLK